MKYLIGPALVAGAFAAPAFAQDGPPASAQAQSAKAFDGLRAEAVAGYDGSLFYGGAAGFDHQSGRLVVGVEGELTESTHEECLVAAFGPGDSFCSRLGRDLYVGGRIGVVLAPSTLLYGKVGYTNQQINVDYIAGTPPALPSFESRAKVDGIRLGAGIEQRIGRNAYLRGEYRYSDYENGDWKHGGLVGIGFRF
jgi:outer membrane immunogenic protein